MDVSKIDQTAIAEAQKALNAAKKNKEKEKEREEFRKNLRSRKLIITLILFVMATIFLYIGRAEFADWADFIKWIFGIYSAGNVGEHYTKSTDDNYSDRYDDYDRRRPRRRPTRDEYDTYPDDQYPRPPRNY